MASFSFKQITLKQTARQSFAANPVSLISLQDGGFLLNFASAPEVIRLDAGMNKVWSKDLQAQSIAYCSCRITVSPDESVMVLSGSSDLRFLDSEGNLLHRIAHRPWYHFLGTDCFFTADNRFAWFVLPGLAEGDDDVLQVLRLSDFTITDKQVVADSSECYQYTFNATPLEHQALLAAAAGQDGQVLFRIQQMGDRIVLETIEACTGMIFGSFAPAGNVFMTAPHNDEDGIAVFSFPVIKKIAELSQELIFAGRDEYPSAEDEDSLNFTAFYLNNRDALVFTRFGRLLLINMDTLQCRGELLPEGCAIRPYDEAGRPATNPGTIVDYGGDIVELLLTKTFQLLITHSSGEIRLYALTGLEA